MPIIKISTQISGLAYIRKLQPIRKIVSEFILPQVMDKVEILAKSSFEDVYQNTPFIHATGRYHDAVQFIRGERNKNLDIIASIPYSDCLECGHGTFSGYWIIEKTRQKIIPELRPLIRNEIRSYFSKIIT
jgi:hypothetical protein